MLEDSGDEFLKCLIIIDEIQETAEVYNYVREFTRKFVCRFIITGSYLGRTLKKVEYNNTTHDFEIDNKAKSSFGKGGKV